MKKSFKSHVSDGNSFSVLLPAEFVRAVVFGLKTQIRLPAIVNGEFNTPAYLPFNDAAKAVAAFPCCTGAEIWVQEDFRISASFDGLSIDEVVDFIDKSGRGNSWVPTQFEADGVRIGSWIGNDFSSVISPGRLRPGSQMPRGASRVSLRVEEIGIDRLQNISKDDCLLEGIEEIIRNTDPESNTDMYMRVDGNITDVKSVYSGIWDDNCAPYYWESNPWVWIVNFRRTP